MRLLLAGCCSGMLGAALAAQGTSLRLPAFRDQPAAECVVLDVRPVLAAHERHGPAGFVTCTVANPSADTHAVELSIGSWQERNVVRDEIRLEPRQRVVRHYAVQRYGQPLSVKATCDGGAAVRSNAFGSATAPVAVLLVTLRAEAVGELQSMLNPLVPAADAPAAPRGRVRVPRVPAAGSGSSTGITEVRPQELPEAWQCYAGFDLLVVDGRSGLDPAGEQALVDAVAAGGALLVLWTESLGEGPLRRALTTAAGGREDGQLAFGRFFTLPGAPRATPGLTRWLVGDAGVGGGVATRARARLASGPAEDWLHAPLVIPGLGEVPVGAFFLLLALFVVLAGPINLFCCRRAGRPLLVALTLPVLGFGFAAAILLWGILAEGLGVRGSVRSVTWLDQRTHVAVNHAGTTLYAGLTPAALTAATGSQVMSLAIQEDWSDESPHRLLVDQAAGGRVGGSLLPARWPTHLVTVTHRRVRERLRFRRLPDGNLETLMGPGLVPAAPGVAVRDHAGQCFLGAPQGDRLVLQRVDERAVRTFLRERRDEVLQLPVRLNEHELSHRARQPVAGENGDPRLAMTYCLLGMFGDLRPGTYAARLAENAAFDQLGLAANFEVAQHLLLGVLGEEDFVD